jgi:hypothetical protein
VWVYGGTLIPEDPEPLGVREILAADPQFRLADFLGLARTIHRNVHAAVASGDRRPVAGVLHEALATELAGRASGGDRAWVHPVERHDHTAVLDASHGDRDVVTVRFGALIGGRATVEDWTFERDAQEYPHLRGVSLDSCFSCGAPLDVDAEGDCRYCGTHLVGVAGRWWVRDVAPPRLIEPPTATTSLEALDPQFPVHDFLAFVRTVYLNVHRATAENALASVGDVLTGDMRAYLASAPDELAWDLAVDSVTRLEIVDVQRGALDRVTVRFLGWSGELDIVEDWTFERPAAGPGQPEVAREACSFCGAPISLDEHGDCRFCGTHLSGVAGSWRLASARTPPQELASHPIVVKAMQRRGGQLVLGLFLVGALLLTLLALVALVLWVS